MKVKFLDIIEKNYYGYRDKNVLEESPQKTSYLKKLSEIVHNIENAKGKMLEADPNL